MCELMRAGGVWYGDRCVSVSAVSHQRGQPGEEAVGHATAGRLDQMDQ